VRCPAVPNIWLNPFPSSPDQVYIIWVRQMRVSRRDICVPMYRGLKLFGIAMRRLVSDMLTHLRWLDIAGSL
jgi:hypothetical protein